MSGNRIKAYRYIFGKEPKDQDVLDFVNKRLLKLIDTHKQCGIPIEKRHKKKNSKKLQRKVAKELKKRSISTKAQEALKDEFETSKKEKAENDKQLKEDKKAYIRKIKVQKAENKHRGR
ncbi:YjdF family protein [Terrilactibacillus laevilacticus]|uniref:YjdF family protein n=1 Tax=Terrilactibacillus laevilacticus TaxID=1380157 RepID=UPI001FEC2FC6|nr:YjdF family protein [Terrilactibacillus laevilacticus]